MGKEGERCMGEGRGRREREMGEGGGTGNISNVTKVMSTSDSYMYM